MGLVPEDTRTEELPQVQESLLEQGTDQEDGGILIMNSNNRAVDEKKKIGNAIGNVAANIVAVTVASTVLDAVLKTIDEPVKWYNTTRGRLVVLGTISSVSVLIGVLIHGVFL